MRFGPGLKPHRGYESAAAGNTHTHAVAGKHRNFDLAADEEILVIGTYSAPFQPGYRGQAGGGMAVAAD